MGGVYGRNDFKYFVLYDIMVLSLGCIAVIVLILIALSVFVPTLIRTIKEELKRGNKDENG